MPEFIKISILPKTYMLKNIVGSLAKEGQSTTRILPSGTKVDYIRGALCSGEGNCHVLYKQITKPDGERFASNGKYDNGKFKVKEILHFPAGESMPDKLFRMVPGGMIGAGYLKHSIPYTIENPSPYRTYAEAFFIGKSAKHPVNMHRLIEYKMHANKELTPYDVEVARDLYLYD